MSSWTSYIVRTENNIRKRERDGPSGVRSSSPGTDPVAEENCL